MTLVQKKQLWCLGECGWKGKGKHLCHCGRCGRPTNWFRKGWRRFIHGHDQVGKEHSYVKSGKDNPSYRGAACVTTRWFIRTQKPNPHRCEGCGILEKALKTMKLPGKAKSKLLLCNISKIYDSKNPDHWKWLCHICRFPRAAKVGKVSDHLCECERKCGEFTLYGWSGKVNRYVVGHNAAGQMLPSKWKPGTPDDFNFRARMYVWARSHLKKPVDGKCQKCGEEPIWKPYTISHKFLRKITDWQWIGRECFRVAG